MFYNEGEWENPCNTKRFLHISNPQNHQNASHLHNYGYRYNVIPTLTQLVHDIITGDHFSAESELSSLECNASTRVVFFM